MRAKHSQEGFVLLSVLLIAVLYFGLIELLLNDSAQRMREAQRFRAVITANILAENAAELAATNMVGLSVNQASAESDDGSISGTYRRVGQNGFLVEAMGVTNGLSRAKRTVTIKGTISGTSVRIHQTRHRQ